MRLILPVLALALGAACSSIPALPEVDDPCATWPEPGLYTIPLDGYDRDGVLYVPASPGPRAAIVALHGASGSGDDMRRTTTFRARADEQGYVAVFPNGSGSPTARTWNAGSCCGPSSELDVDDIGFLEALGKEVRARLCVDRIVAAGFSNGGMVALRWACEGTQVDAVLSAAGPLLVDDCPSAPFPVTIERGSADAVVPIDGSTNTNGTAFPSLQDDLDRLLAANRCAGEPTETTDGATTCRTWTSCRAPVTSCTIEDWPHRWPGDAQQPSGFDAEDEAEGLIEVAAPHRQ